MSRARPGPALTLWAYRGLTRVAAPVAPLILRARARKGKEDPARLSERLGRAGLARPAGPLVWLHAASLGESGAAAILIAHLRAERPDLHFLVTTATLAGARFWAARTALDPRILHQFAPIDTPGAVALFLDHWRPPLGIFLESEIWPNLLSAAQRRGVALALANARMNRKSLDFWARARASGLRLFSAFSFIGAADAATARGLSLVLGRELTAIGNLKAVGPAPSAPVETLARLRAILGTRPVWLAASAHPSEAAALAETQRDVAAARNGAVLILAPRHPERAAAFAEAFQAQDLAFARWSVLAPEWKPPPGPFTLIADRLGEMGLWLRLADAAFIGGSLDPALKGHNPMEAVVLDTPIVAGPHVASFADLYGALAVAGGLSEVGDGRHLAQAVTRLMDAEGRAQAERARSVVASGRQALAASWAGLAPLLPVPDEGAKSRGFR